MFGQHLTLDLYGCNGKKLADEEFVCKLLDELPDIINMHKISKPNVMFYPGSPNSFDQGGVSAFILIAESHISIHTFVEQQYASVDIFSCKNFDVDKVEKFWTEKLDAQSSEKHLISRGKHFPRDIEKVKPIVINQRKEIPIFV